MQPMKRASLSTKIIAEVIFALIIDICCYYREESHIVFNLSWIIHGTNVTKLNIYAALQGSLIGLFGRKNLKEGKP